MVKINRPLKKYRVAFSLGNFIRADYFHKILRGRAILEISDRPDYVFCGVFDKNKFLDHGDKPVRIYFYDENVFPDMNLFDYAIGFQDLSLGGRHMRVPYYYFDFANYKRLLGQKNSSLPNDMTRRRFCNFIYSNPGNGKLSMTRQDFCRALAKRKRVDCPGRVLNNMKNAIEPRNGDWIQGKLDFIKNYKFTIAFENSDSIGYTTEKLIHPLLANSVPIYYGNRDAIRDGFNPRAFINGNDFDSLDELAKFVSELDQDDKRYMKMLREPPLLVDSVPNWDEKIADFIMDILENGRKHTTHGQRLSPFHILLRDSRKIRKFLVRILALFVPCRTRRMRLRQYFGV